MLEQASTRRRVRLKLQKKVKEEDRETRLPLTVPYKTGPKKGRGERDSEARGSALISRLKFSFKWRARGRAGDDILLLT